jgi:hypothetical protein
MGCVLVNKFHIEYDFVTSLDADDLFGRSIHIPEDAVITEVAPEFESGWYQFVEDGSVDNFVSYWHAGEISEYGPSLFREHYQRMQEPQPYAAEVPRIREYTDGYYYAKHVDAGTSMYRRIDGKWEFYFNNRWYDSEYDDSNIESEESGITFVPED